MTSRKLSTLLGCIPVLLALSCSTHRSPATQSADEATRGNGATAASAVRPGVSTTVDPELVVESAREASAVSASTAQAVAAGVPISFPAVRMVETDPASTFPDAALAPGRGPDGISINELNTAEVKQFSSGNVPAVNSGARTLAAQDALLSPPPLFTFEGQPVGNVAPPDTNGAIGPNHYVQQVNNSVAVYDKATHALIGSRFLLSSLFAKLGGTCAITDDGDPVVLYDKLANRWILSQFGFLSQTAAPYHECIAISKTPDPKGAYYAYDFITPGNEFPDYPKLGTWPDAYYMTTNQFFLGGGFDGGGAFAFDRAKMLVGDPTATGIYFNLNLSSHPEGIFGMLPADFDGLIPPPPGEPNVFAYPTSITFGDPKDGVRLFDFHADFTTPANSTFVERPESTYANPVAVAPAWDLRDPSGRGDITQPPPAGNNSTDRLDAVASRLMHRMQYINTGTKETLVTNVTVNNSGVAPTSAANYKAAVRWLELSRNIASGANSIDGAYGGGPPFSVFQNGTIAPTTDHRWMASSAKDLAGDLAVGYSISSLTVKPSLAYSARMPADPPGTLQAEQTLFAGTGVQRGTSNRWGDYSALQLDPSDFCTFWFTSEYYTSTTLTFNWQTRVGAFKFPSCTPPPMGTLNGQVTYTQGGAPVVGAVIQVSDGHGAVTDATGHYSVTLPPGGYNVFATDPAILCNPAPSQSFSVGPGGTATRNFSLSGTALIDLGVTSFDDTAGNNNGVINRDECVKVTAKLANDGCFPETGITGTLSTSTPGVVIDQNFSTYPGLAINQTLPNDTPYRIHTTPSFVCGTPIVFTLNTTGTNGGNRQFSFKFDTCHAAPVPFSGTLTNADPIASNGRMGRNAIASTCAGKTCPGALAGSANLGYHNLTFPNTSAVTECLTINLDQSLCPGAIIDAGYLDSFNGANLCTNYLGDPGGSGNLTSFQVNLPAGHNLVLSMQQVAAGTFCAAGFSGTITGFIDDTPAGASKLNSLSPAHEWIGLKNSDDVGTRFDLKAEVFRNGTLVASNEIDNVSGGSSGFNNANDQIISLALSNPGVDTICSGESLSIKLSAKVTATGGHNTGTIRLWYNDGQATTRFDANIGGTDVNLYLLDGFVLGTSPGAGPKKTIDVLLNRTTWKTLGTWIKNF